ncbi:hypothetical protein [Paracidovorax avenae]|uniref:hypothetical protein n=1 Tax=Paracidovorax avenae TaxID=80867 RepID=UPI000AAAAF96|nr:hypothetical protein [Paracidovorax avenae]
MNTPCIEYYRELHRSTEFILRETFNTPRNEKIARSHSFIQDLALWIEELKGRPEISVLECASREYQFALFSLITGQYRSGFSSLRLALELSLATVQWSANERELREWKTGIRDSNWSVLVDAENGIFSKQFIRLFSEVLADEGPRYRAMAITVYRECSEYVHGNAHTHEKIPKTISFHEECFDAWMRKASIVRLLITFALTTRYIEELNTSSHSNLEGTLLDHLGHSVAVRTIIGAPVEASNG